jgi:hypothetical protein
MRRFLRCPCRIKERKRSYSRQRGRYKITSSNCLKEISRRKKNWSRVPDGSLTPRRTGRLIVCRNVTLTLTLIRRNLEDTRNIILFGDCFVRIDRQLKEPLSALLKRLKLGGGQACDRSSD